MRKHAEEAGRNPSEIDVAFSAAMWYDERNAQQGRDGGRRPLSGTSEQIAGDIRAFGESGVRHLMLNFQSASLIQTLDRMEHFATAIKPLVDG